MLGSAGHHYSTAVHSIDISKVSVVDVQYLAFRPPSPAPRCDPCIDVWDADLIPRENLLKVAVTFNEALHREGPHARITRIPNWVSDQEALERQLSHVSC